MPFFIGSKKLSSPVNARFFKDALEALNALPEPKIYYTKVLSEKDQARFVFQREGISVNLRLEASKTEQITPDFLATTGISSCFLVYGYTASGDRFLIHWDMNPCDLEKNIFIPKGEAINIILAGGHVAVSESQLILKKIITTLVHYAEKKEVPIRIVSQKTLGRNLFIDAAKPAYFADFILRRMDELYKFKLDKPLPKNLVRLARFDLFDRMLTLEKGVKEKLDALTNLILMFDPKSIRGKPSSIIMAIDIFWSTLADKKTPAEIEDGINFLFPLIFSKQGFSTIKMSLGFSSAFAFKFPSTNLRNVAVNLEDHSISQITSLHDQRNHRLLRTLRLFDFGLLDSPCIFDASGETTEQVAYQEGFPKACKKILAEKERVFGKGGAKFYQPMLLDYINHMFAISQYLTSPVQQFLAIMTIQDFIRFCFKPNPECFSRVNIVSKEALLTKQDGVPVAVTVTSPTPISKEQREKDFRIAAVKSDFGLMKKSIKDYKVNINAVGAKSQRSALHWAAIKGKQASVIFLLEHGANPNLEDDGGLTPLHLIVMGTKLNFDEKKQLIKDFIIKADVLAKPRIPYGMLIDPDGGEQVDIVGLIDEKLLSTVIVGPKSMRP